MPLLTSLRAITPVGPEHIGGALDLCALRPVEGVSLAHQLHRWKSWGRGDAIVAGRPGHPDGAAWTTGSMMPFGVGGREAWGYAGASASQIKAMADHARGRLTSRGSVFGPAQDVEPIWNQLETLGMRAREVRACQPLLQASDVSQVEARLRRRPETWWAATGVSRARAEDEDLVLPASVDMFVSELGYDPRSSGGSYARHVSWLIGQGRTYLLCDDGEGRPPIPGGPRVAAFKVDVGALWAPPVGPAVAQLTGVWTRRDVRGRGLAAAALAGAIDAIRADHVGAGGIVSLYVNDFNEGALALYRSVNFRRVGTFATVLL